jgi:hypothetical protein
MEGWTILRPDGVLSQTSLEHELSSSWAIWAASCVRALHIHERCLALLLVRCES